MSNFTPRAQQVLALARKEADRFNHNFLGTEHLLLGLIKLGQGVAVNVIQKMGLDLETVRMEVEKQVGTGPDQKMIGNIPYTPRVKKVLALASKEAKALNHTYVGTEHILLGLLREGDGWAGTDHVVLLGGDDQHPGPNLLRGFFEIAAVCDVVVDHRFELVDAVVGVKLGGSRGGVRRVMRGKFLGWIFAGKVGRGGQVHFVEDGDLRHGWGLRVVSVLPCRA